MPRGFPNKAPATGTEEAETIAVVAEDAEVVSQPQKIMIKAYELTVDGIVGTQSESHSEEIPGYYDNKNLYTKADLEALGCDFGWLLRSGSIREAGYKEIG